MSGDIIPLQVLNFEEGFDRLTHVVAGKIGLTPEAVYLCMMEPDFQDVLPNEPDHS